jgi:hypothetical protein
MQRHRNLNSYGPEATPAQAGGEDGLSMSRRFGYTGQMRLPELDLYHYKARASAPRYANYALSPETVTGNESQPADITQRLFARALTNLPNTSGFPK